MVNILVSPPIKLVYESSPGMPIVSELVELVAGWLATPMPEVAFIREDLKWRKILRRKMDLSMR